MRRQLIEILAPANSNTKYKIWVALSLIIQVSCALLPAVLWGSGSLLHHAFYFGSVGIAVISLLLIRTEWQKWIAYSIALYGLSLVYLLVVLQLTNTGILIYLLAWSMSVSLGYGRELFNLKWFFGFMSLVVVLFAAVLMVADTVEANLLERALNVASGTVIILINIYLWSLEARMASNHYSERRKKYEDIALLSEKMTAILSENQGKEQAFRDMAKESEPSLHLDFCMIYLYKDDNLYSVDGKEVLSTAGKSVICESFRTNKLLVNTDTRLSNYERPQGFPEARSEIAVPITNNGSIQGVLYGAGTSKDMLRERHSEAMSVIASFCGLKLTQEDAENSIRDAEKTKAEVIQYRELDALKNRFIANISHDLKTPLSLIKAPAKQIAQLTDDEKIKSLSNYIINNADHLLRVVHQLLQLNRVEKGVNELYLQDVEMRSLCRKISGQYEERAGSQHIAFNIMADEVVVHTDAFRLEQIFHNLLSNALRYTPAGGTISLRVTHDDTQIYCTVSDTGAGIPAALQKKVFERFYKVDENNQEGTGIGLSLVKEYVQMLEGTVDMESLEGQGTTFHLQFPIKHGQSQATQESTEQPDHAPMLPEDGKPVMLIVEDHADLNEFIRTYFENTFVTLSASDGAKATELLAKHLPDIIITDLMMPVKDGSAFVQEVRSNDDLAHIPIIVLSAKSQISSKIELYEKGVDNFLPKPFDIEELEAVVNATLKQRKSLRDSLRSNFLTDIPATVIDNEPLSEVEQEQQPSIQASTLLQDLKAFILENLDNSELSTADIAKAMGMGRNRFQKEIKALSGVTPVEFMRSVRLSEAYNQLQDRSKNISEVAYAVGFSNLSYFTRSFKQEFGVLPSSIQTK